MQSLPITPLPLPQPAAAVRRPAPPTQPTRRIHTAFTAAAEQRFLHWLARRAPAWLTSDQLTLLGFAAQLAAGLGYALAGVRPWALVLVDLCILLNWLGDSLDGTLARVRNQQRPRFGFYVDHMVDVFGAVALLGGLALSRLLHPGIAAAMLIAFLVLCSESYLAAHTLAEFHLAHLRLGPTELRLFLIVANLALLRSPWCTVLGHRLLLLDVGGALGSAGMFTLAVRVTLRHTARLYREEPLP